MRLLDIIKQPIQGYRFNVDSYLLARFACFHASDHVIDLGAGVGILAILSLLKGGAKKATALELQEKLSCLAEENVASCGLQGRMQVIRANWRQVSKHLRPRSFHVVISNPPYRKLKSGRLPPDSSRAIARHELKGTMRDLIKSAKYLIKPSGRLYLMYPPLRLEELILELDRTGFKIQRLACVHPYFDRPATLVMVEAVLSDVREMKLEAPVVVWRDAGHYAPEIEAYLGRKLVSHPLGSPLTS